MGHNKYFSIWNGKKKKKKTFFVRNGNSVSHRHVFERKYELKEKT